MNVCYFLPRRYSKHRENSFTRTSFWSNVSFLFIDIFLSV